MKPLSLAFVYLAATSMQPSATAGGDHQPWFKLDAPLTAKTSAADDWSMSYKDGLKLSNGDGSNSIKIGGRLMADFGWQSGDDKPGGEQVEFRRARLYVKGTLGGNVQYKVNYDFARSTEPVSYKDVYMQFSDLHDLRIGHFKEYNSLSTLTSSKYITMIERAAIVNAISPGRNTGAGIQRTIGDASTVALGLFKDTSNGFSDETGKWSATGRFTHLLSDSIHLGVSASARGNSAAKASTRPGHHMAGSVDLVDDANADDSTLLGIEAAWIGGALSLQSEYISQSFESANDAEVQGYYLMASYFLTGEQRAYSSSIGAFGRVVPAHEGGAYELTARFDHAEGDNGTTVEVNDLILGVNWYTGRNSRIMLNYVMADVDGGTTEASYDALLLRFQVDF